MNVSKFENLSHHILANISVQNSYPIRINRRKILRTREKIFLLADINFSEFKSLVSISYRNTMIL